MKNKLPLFFTLSLSLAAIGLFCLGYWANKLFSFVNLEEAIAQYFAQSELNLSALQQGLMTLGGLLFLLTILLFLLRHKISSKLYAILLLVSLLVSLVLASFMAVSR
jgi:Na+/melibiose symporter-like transporter